MTDPDRISDEALKHFIEGGVAAGKFSDFAAALSGFYTRLVEGGMPEEFAFSLTTTVAELALDTDSNEEEVA